MNIKKIEIIVMTKHKIDIISINKDNQLHVMVQVLNIIINQKLV